ncbi:kinase-like domain-containing protein [Thelephora terrestris]|uniref:Kinase-like domain-containing protein n=1 Tax=Thelephora terrestris TaxID=56493 RepID=A0A9P6H479_9AGAM|nr:kinase-like domain-containing protein [Thelephora terrestris]
MESPSTMLVTPVGPGTEQGAPATNETPLMIPDAESWTNLYRMEVTSNDSLTRVRSLLSHRSSTDAVRRFQGSDAQTFVDFLDRILVQPYLGHKLWQRGLRLLSKICEAHSIVPASYIRQQELICMGTVRYRGGFADVRDGEYLGRHVAIKSLRNEGDSPKSFKRLCREIICWKHLSHPNILPLLGVSISTNRRSFKILTEWMPNGNVKQYTRSNPEANRLKLLSEVMSGVTYIHGLRVVHGDLKGANILVDNAGTACVADFGLMTMTDASAAILSGTAVSPGGTYGWMSPELLDPSRFGSDGRPTRESDCYALGMVIYEVLTGLRPFHYLIAPTPVPAVMRGERPIKPISANSLGLTETIWELVELCWSESSLTRPTAQQLLDCISSASLTWAPPLVYPAARVDFSSIVDPDSNTFDSLTMLTPVSQGVETITLIGGLLVLVIVLLLFILPE